MSLAEGDEPGSITAHPGMLDALLSSAESLRPKMERQARYSCSQYAFNSLGGFVKSKASVSRMIEHPTFLSRMVAIIMRMHGQTATDLGMAYLNDFNARMDKINGHRCRVVHAARPF